MNQTRNTLSENIRAQSIELLDQHLAASIDLRAQVEQGHWNARGPSFIAVPEILAVVGSLAAFGRSSREAIGSSTVHGDVATADLFTAISRGIDQQLWLVESHLPHA
ncbi:MAG: hypothetical protein OEL76_07785 [Siculibacillus sp.]|nr:hypothetical protein [Siculibacillus sp.]